MALFSQNIKFFRSLQLFGLLLLMMTTAGCASSSKSEPVSEIGQEGEDDILSPTELAEEAREEFRQNLVEEFKDVIRHEILPEIQALSPVPPSARKRRKKAANVASEKSVLGRVEWVEFESPGFAVQARIDTGAQTSSLHAENQEEKTIDGDLYVQYETIDQNGDRHVLLNKVITSTTVRSSSGQSTKRYVVKKRLTMGGQTHEININLNDRSGLRYRFLAGRNLLMGNYVVDVSQSRVLGK